MNMQLLAHSDLNLLITFQVLMEEKSVTRAASRLFISQPAMSKTLKRMRDMFGDPLFTRTAHGLIATPRAEALHKEIPALLSAMEQLISNQGFDANTYSGSFKIASSDTFGYLLPNLLQALAISAPAIKIDHVPMSDDIEDRLRRGDIDFAIHKALIPSNDIIADRLRTGSLRCLMRSTHPLSHKPQLSLEDYLAYGHVRHLIPHITASGLGLIDELLAKQRLQRRVVFATPYTELALRVIEQTDYLLLVSTPFDTQTLTKKRFHLAAMPTELAVPSRPLELLHHKRAAENPAHKWLRQQIIEAA